MAERERGGATGSWGDGIEAAPSPTPNPGASGQVPLPPELLDIPGVAEAFAARAGGTPSSGPTVYMGQRPGSWKRLGGSDVRSRDDAVADFYTWDDEKLKDFQERAFAAGLYGTRDRRRIRWGDPTDGDTFNLWVDRVEAAAGFYNDGAGRKVSPWDTLDLAGQGAEGLDDGPGRQPLSVELSNPEDVKRGLRAAAKEVVGSADVDDATLDRMVAAWHAEQRSAQQAAYNASESGGTVIQGPDFETFAEQETRKVDPLKADARKTLSAFDFVAEMFQGGSSAA